MTSEGKEKLQIALSWLEANPHLFYRGWFHNNKRNKFCILQVVGKLANMPLFEKEEVCHAMLNPLGFDKEDIKNISQINDDCVDVAQLKEKLEEYISTHLR